MPRNKEIIPRAPLARILKEMGAPRVSAEAAEAMGKMLTKIAKEIGRRAQELAEHAGRKTVLGEDVKLAAKERDLRQS